MQTIDKVMRGMLDTTAAPSVFVFLQAWAPDCPTGTELTRISGGWLHPSGDVFLPGLVLRLLRSGYLREASHAAA